MKVAHKDVLASMFRDNTGKHFLDSGSAYGRNWERNQGKDLDLAPTATLEVSSYDDNNTIEFSLGLSAYHFCKQNLDFNPKFDAKFQRFAKKKEFEDSGWLEIIEAWLTSLEAKYHVTGFYGDGKPSCVNTYNHQNNLDQTLQFTVFELHEKDDNTSSRRHYNATETLCILQVHGGCDVRGGYTSPRVFTTLGDDGTEMFDYAKGSIGCENNHYWWTDDAYHWYTNDSSVEFTEKDTLFGDVTREIPIQDLNDYSAQDFDYNQTGEYSWEGIAHCPVCKVLGNPNVLLEGSM